jgi:branched-chain amino acid transport system permease protein
LQDRSIAWLEREPIVGLALVLAILPWIVPQKTLAIEVLIFTLLAASFNLLLGYAGVLSLGHSSFFGLGAYAAGILLAKTGIVNLWLALLMGIAAPALLAIPIGWFSLRRRLLYFTMLTLAFNQMVYFGALQARGLTGGDDGLQGIVIPPLQLPGITLSIDSLLHPFNFSDSNGFCGHLR